MDDEQRTHLEELRKDKQRRLRLLERQQAPTGASTPPEILMEIEDLRAEIACLQDKLARTERAQGIATPSTGDPGADDLQPAESMKLFRGLGDQRGVAECLEGWAFAAQTLGYIEPRYCEPAARLLGAASALRTITQTRPQHADRDELDAAIATARDQLGDAYDAAWEAGRAMSLEQAIAYALELFPISDP
jgi:hypothetical protein